MGNSYQLVKRKIFGTPAKVILIGEYGAGRTTALFKIKLGQKMDTPTTIGFNNGQVELGGCKMSLWDFSGSVHFRRLWQQYFEDCEGLAFFIDLSHSDQDYFDASRILLHAILQMRQVQQVPLLLICNKKDIAAISLEEAVARHHIEGLAKPILKIVSACSITGQGLTQAFHWLGEEILKRR